jgi:hypothetical protein
MSLDIHKWLAQQADGKIPWFIAIAALVGLAVLGYLTHKAAAWKFRVEFEAKKEAKAGKPRPKHPPKDPPA